MADHQELVAEISALEQMGTQERQKLAKKRRLQQLKKWSQREKEWIAKERQLNKRLANMLHEENNGLNLKQYTTYGSNQRPKKRLPEQPTHFTTTTSSSNGLKSSSNSKTSYFNNNNNNNYRDNHLAIDGNGHHDTNLLPNGRVHFDVGVMLLEAAARNDIDEVKRLLMLGVSPDSVNHDGLTALHQCCIDASEPIMKLLMEFGANVDARDTEQWTPLHAACTCGHLNLVKILVEHGADLLAVNSDGNMPFDICEDNATLDYIESQMVERGITQDMIDITRASTEVRMISDLEQLVSNGGDLSTANKDGVTPLHIASANGYLSVVKFLLKHGVNVNACDKDLWTPLHGAACWGNEQHLKVVELLVEAGAQLNAKTVNDETAFDLCDNVSLLDKLNELKDELESKQATDTDRLKRTQSRTNSRVHSVRRTSVRDKNQISRREAREEALLRVENSPSKDSATKDSNGSAETSAAKTTSDRVDGLKDPENDTNCQAIEKENSNSETSIISSSLKFDSEATRSHHLPLTNCKKESHPKQTETSLDNENCSSHGKHAQTEEGDLSIRYTNHNSGNGIATNERSTNNHLDNVKSDSSIPPATKRSSEYIKSKHLIDQRSKSDTSDLIRASEGTSGQKSRQNDLASDQRQPSGSAVQLIPISYTLSNLKKHRSDLRMRTTSIGGGTVIPMSTKTLSAPNSSTMTNGLDLASSGQQQVAMDPEPKSFVSKTVVNGESLEHRPESPSPTFRKFHGEPSEVFGDKKRRSGHKCCVII